MGAEIDAADVLSSYSSLLMRPTGSVIRNAAELKYSKQIIKIVLIHCIKLTEPGEQREFLRAAYVSLADFQELSDDERAALDIFEAPAGDKAEDIGLEDLRTMAKLGASHSDLAVGVYGRVAAESARLLQELQAAGF